MALTNNGVRLWVSEHLSDTAADVIEMQRNLDNQFASEYTAAYAYGEKGDPRKVHERVAQLGAQQLGIAHELYLSLWDQAVRVIDQYWEIPEEFRDVEKYESE